jgi:hypothetical protein
MSHTVTVVSAPDAISVPSGENATAKPLDKKIKDCISAGLQLRTTSLFEDCVVRENVIVLDHYAKQPMIST